MKVAVAFVLMLSFIALVETIRRRGLDRVLIKRRERPSRLLGCEVQIFDAERKDLPDWLSPNARVISHDGGCFRVQFEQPWKSPYGSLTQLDMRSATEGLPLSWLAGKKTGSVPVFVILPDGSEQKLDCGIVSTPARRWESALIAAGGLFLMIAGGADLYRNARIHFDGQVIDALVNFRHETRTGHEVCYELFVPERSAFYGPDSWRGRKGGCVRVSPETYRLARNGEYMPVYYSAGSPWWNRPTLPTLRENLLAGLSVLAGALLLSWILRGKIRR